MHMKWCLPEFCNKNLNKRFLINSNVTYSYHRSPSDIVLFLSTVIQLKPFRHSYPWLSLILTVTCNMLLSFAGSLFHSFTYKFEQISFFVCYRYTIHLICLNSITPAKVVEDYNDKHNLHVIFVDPTWFLSMTLKYSPLYVVHRPHHLLSQIKMKNCLSHS